MVGTFYNLDGPRDNDTWEVPDVMKMLDVVQTYVNHDRAQFVRDYEALDAMSSAWGPRLKGQVGAEGVWRADLGISDTGQPS